jgi:phosphoglycerol transferase MdoB-like AlkP superfamily enzyme
MLGTNWHKALLLFLWISPHVLLVVLAAVIWKRRLYLEFPCFFAYVLFRIAVFILLFTLYWIQGISGPLYAYAFSATLMLIIALGFGVIDEISQGLFRESLFLKTSARRFLQCVAGLLFAVG